MIVHRKVQHQNKISHRPVKKDDHLRLLIVIVCSKRFRRFIDDYLISVQDNGQIRSFVELVGAALNFHKTGLIEMIF